ncbi:phospholipid phosphatase 1-like isoform X2 [Lineus longissimus]|uniref:phospholipid phosphatase 1-like isoform X2 n=1 Tax=Lineus longissimus TaxID=88925 RepID=UPI00315DB79A
MAISNQSRLILRIVIDAICYSLAILPIIILRSRPSPYRRGFFCNDQSIMYPYKETTVSTGMLTGGCFGMVILAVVVIELIVFFKFTRKIASPPSPPLCCCKLNGLFLGIYRYFGIFIFGAAVCMAVTFIFKNVTGRMRPHFFDVCKPNWSVFNCSGFVDDYNCTGKEVDKILEARLSFPSGHASLAVYTATYVMSVVMFLGIYVAVTRVVDNMHHWSDVLAGSLLGFGIASVMVFAISDLYHKPLAKSHEQQLADHWNEATKSNDIV